MSRHVVILDTGRERVCYGPFFDRSTASRFAVALIEQACCAAHLAWIAASAIVRLAVAVTDETPVEPILARLHEAIPYQVTEAPDGSR